VGDLKDLRRKGTITSTEFRHRLHTEKDKYFKKIDQIGEEFAGVTGASIKQDFKAGLKDYTHGSLKRFETFSHHTRTPIIFSSVITSVIGFAGTVMFFNSISSRHHLKHLEETLKQKEQNTARS
jgi:hypothetical protein